MYFFFNLPRRLPSQEQHFYKNNYESIEKGPILQKNRFFWGRIDSFSLSLSKISENTNSSIRDSLNRGSPSVFFFSILRGNMEKFMLLFLGKKLRATLSNMSVLERESAFYPIFLYRPCTKNIGNLHKKEMQIFMLGSN